MGSPFARTYYDVVIAGARCAGASTAMLMARRGLRVLVVDPVQYGKDTLSTHALMRGAVLQLHRWGLLDAVRAAGAPPIGTTTFHYGDESVEVTIKSRDGVDALYAPRRTVLDPIVVDAARVAGAEVVYGQSIVDLVRDDDGRVSGAKIAGPDRQVTEVSADLVIGADGASSKVARLLGLEADYLVPDAACIIYSYWRDVPLSGYHWYYRPGVSAGTIATNDGDTCLAAMIPQARFLERKHEGLEALHLETMNDISPELAEHVASTRPSDRLRAFAGAPGFLRRAAGPGWALVGDAAYFRDPITAHGITDAFREAELLARAFAEEGGGGLPRYRAGRDERVKGLLDVTHSIAAFEWNLDQVKADHLELNRQMNAQVDVLRALD
ncbi:MAG: NAD(P)/FAD-dependent oxidoreductase [Gemmatimonadota bacterium]